MLTGWLIAHISYHSCSHVKDSRTTRYPKAMGSIDSYPNHAGERVAIPVHSMLCECGREKVSAMKEALVEVDEESKEETVTALECKLS
jgi:hypothetical protein